MLRRCRVHFGTVAFTGLSALELVPQTAETNTKQLGNAFSRDV